MYKNKKIQLVLMLVSFMFLLSACIDGGTGTSQTDTTAPSVAITSPANGTTTTPGVIEISGTASDDTNLAAVEISIDGGTATNVSGLGNWSYSWDASSASLGIHTIVVTARDDADNESQASINITLNHPGVINIVTQSQSVNEDVGSVTFVAERSGGTQGAVSVDWTTVNQTALDTADYQGNNGLFSWADGESGQKQVSIPIVDDTNTEGSEYFDFQIGNPQGGASLGNNTSISITINANDSKGTVRIFTPSQTVNEGDVVQVQFERVGGTTGAVSVDWGTLQNTAVKDLDYSGQPETLNWADGVGGTITRNVTIIDDTEAEADEDFRVVIQNAQGGAVLDSDASEITLTIATNDDPSSLTYEDLENLPKVTLNDFEYQGAFRVVHWTYSGTDTSISGSKGIFTIDPVKNTIFVVSNDDADEIAEFEIPEIVNTTDLTEVITTEKVLQKFTNVLDRVPNPQDIDKITGLFLHNGSLIVNAQRYYDANADNTNTTLKFTNAYDIVNSPVLGYYDMEGTGHAAGWVSEIPLSMQNLFQGKYLVGHASNNAINTRNPMGITAFVLDNDFNAGPGNTIPTTALMDFDLVNFMYKEDADYNSSWGVYGYNIYGCHEDGVHPDPNCPDRDADGNILVNSNDLWTEVSEARYGFIVPGTRTYVVIGSSGGHQSGMGYKMFQDNGNECGGPCSYDPYDNYNYYWLFDIKDLIDARNGDMELYEPRPYEYGVFNTPFQTGGVKRIGGGYYDKATKSLYLSIRKAGKLYNHDLVPLFLKYKITP